MLLLLVFWHPGGLTGQQPSPPPVPPSQGTDSPKAQTAVPVEVLNLQQHNHSSLRLERPNHSVDVYLFAQDEKAIVLDAPFCGGDQGAAQFSGQYQLVSVETHAVASRLDLDPDVNFVQKKPHDGARLYHDPKSGQDLVALFQYGNCNSETAQFFSVDPSAQLFAIPFLDKDGHTGKEMLTGPDGAILHLADGSAAFCSYSNDTGYNFCQAYLFDGANFLETAKWMTHDLTAPAQGLTPASQAKRALYEFLSDLSVKNYRAAAYYFAGKVGSPEALSTATTGQKAEALQAYCTTEGGQCLTPVQLEIKPGADAQGTMLFQVSLQTAEFKTFKIGNQSSFEFHVAKIGDEFKVLDLPPLGKP